MAFSFKKLFKTKQISSTYDTYNSPVAALTSLVPGNGIRCELTKTLAPFWQISAISSGSKKQLESQYFSTFSFKNSIFQFCFDPERNYQIKSSLLAGPFVLRTQSIVSKNKETYSRLEGVLHAKFCNLGFKLISPAFQASNFIYIVNYWQAIGKFCFGAEAVAADSHLGLSFSSRLDTDNSVYCLNLERFNVLTVSYFRRLFKNVEIGVEAKKSSKEYTACAGVKIESLRSKIKIALDRYRNTSFSWDERITENITVNFTATHEKTDGLEYGVGIFYES